LIVISYVMTVTGIPVYLHYCGGELEEISYLTKTTSCCGEEEEDDTDSDCCKNESQILKNTIDFTHNTNVSSLPFKSCTNIFFLSKLFSSSLSIADSVCSNKTIDHSPPRPQHAVMLSITVLRI